MLARLPKKLIPYGIVLASWTYYLAYFNYGITMNDEGFLIENVMRVVGGAVPQRDFYGYPPLRYFYIAGWFEVLGSNWSVERIAFVFVRVLTPLLLFLIARRFVSLRVALIPAVMVALIAGPWEKTIDTFLPIFNLWLLLLYCERSSRLRLVMCGISAGITLFFKQDLGLGTIVAETLFVALFGNGRVVTRAAGLGWDGARIIKLGIYFGGVALGLAPVMVGYALVGALPQLWAGLWTAVTVEETNGWRFLGLWRQLDPRHPRGFVEAVLVYLSFLTLVALPLSLVLRWRREGMLDPKVVAAWFLAGIAYPITFIFPVYTRMTQTAPIGYVLATLQVVWLVQWLGEHHEQRRTARIAALGCLLVPVAFLVYGLTDNDMYIGSIAIRWGRSRLIPVVRAALTEADADVSLMKPVIEHVAGITQVGDPIFASYDHAFYFLTDRQNSTGIYFLPVHLGQNPPLREQFLSDLQKNPPKVLIRRTSELGDPDQNPAWWSQYVQSEFRVAFQNASYVVYDRVPSK